MVTTLTRECESASGVEIEVRTESDEIAHAFRTLGDQRGDRINVAEPCPGDQGVVQVLLRSVVVSECRCDAALGPSGGAPPQRVPW